MAQYFYPGSKVFLGYRHTGTVRKILTHPGKISGKSVPASAGRSVYVIEDDRNGKLWTKRGNLLHKP